MPELPEVENIIRQLRPKVVGRKIIELEASETRLFRDHKNIEEVRKSVVGQKIVSCRRIGKNIFFDFEDGHSLALHLMMTGRLLLNPEKTQPHDRAAFILADGSVLVFNDTRKFGRCRIVEAGKNICGDDALLIAPEKFYAGLQKKKAPVKTALLDQAVVAGIGNIYADEILWDAKVHPQKPAHSLAPAEIKNIFFSMKKVLSRAIANGGTTFRDYRKPDGSSGKYFSLRNVYRREGEKCRKDKGIIKKIVLGGRSTHFCPRHQKLTGDQL